MPLKSYLAILQRRWWLLLLGVLVAGVVAFAVSKQLTPVYRAGTQLLVINQTQPGSSAPLNDILTDQQVTNTYVLLIQRREILDQVIARLRLPISGEELQEQISVQVLADTQLILVSVDDQDASRAAAIANMLAMTFIADIEAQFGRAGTVSIAEEALAPTSPVRPDIAQNVLIAVVLGLILVTGLVAILEYQDDTVKSLVALQPLGLSTVGAISKFRKRKRTGQLFLPQTADTLSVLEDFRALRTSVQFHDSEHRAKSLLVCSYARSEGRSTVAANLANVLAQAGEQVTLVDTDLRNPSLHNYFDVANSGGLTKLLTGTTASIDSLLVDTPISNLKFLPSGSAVPNPSELLTSRRMGEVIAELEARSDLVIFDSPSASEFSDAMVLAAQLDRVLLVAERGKTRIGELEKMRDALTSVHGTILGLVLNKLSYRGRRPLEQQLHSPESVVVEDALVRRTRRSAS